MRRLAPLREQEGVERMQKGLTTSLAGALILVIVLFGFSGHLRENQTPNFVFLSDGILWLESSEKNVSDDIEKAKDYLSKRNLEPNAIYFKQSQVVAVCSALELDTATKQKVLSHRGILFDCRRQPD